MCSSDLIRNLFKEVLDLEFGEFPHMTFEEAMRRYGSDKPDLRNPLELVDVADQLKDVDFKVFSGPANDPKCRIAALRVPGAASMPPWLLRSPLFTVSVCAALIRPCSDNQSPPPAPCRR